MKVVFAGLADDRVYRMLAPGMGGFEFSAVETDRLAEIGEADVLIAHRGRWGQAELTGLPITLLQRFGAGYDSVDLNAADQLGIWVANVPSLPSGNADAVADHAVFLILGVARRAKLLFKAVESHSWEYPFGTTLKGKTACLVGMGGLGLAIAVRLQAMGMRLVGVRRNTHKLVPEEIHFEAVFSEDEIHEAMSISYCTILAASVSPGSSPIIGDRELSAMPDGAILINVARGSLVDEPALLRALDSGRLAGAGLDVFAEEPPRPDNPLPVHPLVFATPHCAGSTHESLAGIATYVASNLRQYVAGKKMGSIVNHPHTPRFRLNG